MEEIKVTIEDTTGLNTVLNELKVTFSKKEITVKELIEARVIKEVADYNTKLPEYFRGLVQPTEAEKTINGFKLRVRKQIDPEKQVYVALDAFQKNAFFILVNNYQVDSLEETIRLEATTKVSFVKLTQLVGG